MIGNVKKRHEQLPGKSRPILMEAVAGEIEGMHLDFHMCRICGSTIDEKPFVPCTICNRSLSNYDKIQSTA
jgi:rubrerythrin